MASRRLSGFLDQDLFTRIELALALGSAGLFHYERDGPAAYALTVLDSTRRRLVVQIVIL